MDVERRRNRVAMKVSLRLILDTDLDSDYCRGLEPNLVGGGTWW